MTKEEKIELLNKLLEIEKKNDIGNLTRAERGEFQQWINDALGQKPCDKCVYSTKDGYCQYDDITETIPPFEPCEDAISRQAVLDLISKFIFEIHTEGGRDLSAHTNDVLRQILRNVGSDRVLPSVNPQKPKTDVLDKIRTEIERQEKWLLQAGYTSYNADIAFDAIKSVLAESEDKE